MSDPSTHPLADLSRALASLVERAATGVVAVHSHRSLSSGFAWRDGLVVTAEEALAEEGEVAVTLPGGERRDATLLGRDASTDVALLKVEGLSSGPVTAAEPPRVGALVVAVGAEGGFPRASLGAIAHVGPEWHSMRGGRIDARIDLDLSLRRQSEGGPVLDSSGGLVGMAVLGPRRRVLVIPASTVERVAASLQRHGRIPRGYLGLGLRGVRVDGGGRGAMVMGVDEAGPGARAGVRQGDVVLTWNREAVAGADALTRKLGPDSVGQAVTLGLRRAGEPMDVTITVGERPAP